MADRDDERDDSDFPQPRPAHRMPPEVETTSGPLFESLSPAPDAPPEQRAMHIETLDPTDPSGAAPEADERTRFEEIDDREADIARRIVRARDHSADK